MKSVRHAAVDTYSDLLYSGNPGVKNNNCYAYSIDHYRDKGDDKLQPGELAGIKGPVDLGSCKDLIRRVLADGKAMGWDVRFLGKRSGSSVCSSKAMKIVALLAPNTDFHFMRFHKDLLYRIKTPRTAAQLSKEFGVGAKHVSIPGNKSVAEAGDLVLIRGANCWSQKAGFSPEGPLLRDACGKVIKDVGKACRDMGDGLNYKVICGYFCVQK